MWSYTHLVTYWKFILMNCYLNHNMSNDAAESPLQNGYKWSIINISKVRKMAQINTRVSVIFWENRKNAFSVSGRSPLYFKWQTWNFPRNFSWNFSTKWTSFGWNKSGPKDSSMQINCNGWHILRCLSRYSYKLFQEKLFHNRIFTLDISSIF